MSTFREKLGIGQAGESAIGRWLRRRGFSIVPAYEKIIDTGKGPRLFTPDQQLVSPDMLAFKPREKNVIRWVEAKQKTVWDHYRKGAAQTGIDPYWVTGIDRRHWDDYLKISKGYAYSIWLLFLHTDTESSKKPYDPWPCPTGLFGMDLRYLAKHIDHSCPPTGQPGGYGPTGMVYWHIGSLWMLDTLDNVVAEC